MSQPNDLDEIGLKTKGKKSKGILYYFQPWKWKKKAVVEVESDVKQKQRRNSGYFNSFVQPEKQWFVQKLNQF